MLLANHMIAKSTTRGTSALRARRFTNPPRLSRAGADDAGASCASSTSSRPQRRGTGSAAATCRGRSSSSSSSSFLLFTLTIGARSGSLIDFGRSYAPVFPFVAIVLLLSRNLSWQVPDGRKPVVGSGGIRNKPRMPVTEGAGHVGNERALAERFGRDWWAQARRQ